MKKKSKILVSLICSVAMLSCATLGIISSASAETTSKSANSKPEKTVVGDYAWTNPDIAETPPYLEEMSLADKEWFEYVDYQYYSSNTDDDYIYKIYTPTDYGKSSIMAIRDYNPDEGGINGSTTAVSVSWQEYVEYLYLIAVGAVGVAGTGGLVAGIYGGVAQGVGAAAMLTCLVTEGDVLKNAPYYSLPEFMGINGDADWNGISNTGFYVCDSMTISMSASETFSVQKTNSMDSTYTIKGSLKTKASVKAWFVTAEVEMNNEASNALKFGLNYQRGQSINNSITVSRTFSARKDKEVANIGWKLVEYVVRVPYRVDVMQTDEEGNESIVATSYVTQDLLRGVCRVFANGYIEHWNTGELVAYADFFEGFITATELIDTAKLQMGGQQ
ncbi:MAG: hypothetical protein IJ706_01075 [Clostridia bacterium]|nr:hypothetical protein [Clostridia bacterium]